MRFDKSAQCVHTAFTVQSQRANKPSVSENISFVPHMQNAHRT